MWLQEEFDDVDWWTAVENANLAEAAGYSDWRLPNIKELASFDPIDICYHWSSTTSMQTLEGAYTNAMIEGECIDHIAQFDKSSYSLPFRLVRGGYSSILISNIAVSDITTNSATITWTTDQLSDSLVDYGETTGYGGSAYDATLTTSHSITLDNLTASSTYHFKVTSTDDSGLSASSGDDTFTTLSAPAGFTATTIGDYGNVTVMEVTGNYDAKNFDGSINSIPRQEITKEFYRQHSDTYDFFVIFSNFDFLMPEAGAKGFYLEVKNSTEGIGKTLFDSSSFFGSNGKLQGTIDMGNILSRATLLDANFDDNVDTITHEQLHRWGANVRFRDGAADSTALIGRHGNHWSYLLDSDASVHYGNDWQVNGDGIFTSTGGLKYYSPLDLYLMGMYDRTEVPPMLLIDNPAIDATKLPEPGATITGTYKSVTIDDIIASEGDRIPSASTSQKAFKVGFILITTPGTFDSNVLPGIENIRNAYAGRFVNLTHNRGSITGVDPSLTVGVSSPSNGATINKPSITVTGVIINSTGNETGVVVNGIPATVYGTRFTANNMPLTEGSNTITVNAIDTAGSPASTYITVNAVTTGNHIKLSSNIDSGIAPLEVTLKIDASFSINNSSINITGPSQAEFLPSSPDEDKVRLKAEGIYTLTASATDINNNTYTDTIAITVLNKDQLNIMLKGKWEGMKGALMIGDTETALTYINTEKRETHRNKFEALAGTMPAILDTFVEFNFVKFYKNTVGYEIVANENGVKYSYPITFIIDTDGIWRFKKF
ncbi:MAG: hypothetical protein HZC48_11915 [Nitrospirae bacterium]|nr:hypothetical protein [Nitrospirota bacterium]